MKHYSKGFALSLLLTLCAFGLVQEHYATHHAFPSHDVLTVFVLGLAILQLLVQVVYFLHIGRGAGKKDTVMLALAALTITLFVGGTLWIMANLSHMGSTYDGPVAPQYEND